MSSHPDQTLARNRRPLRRVGMTGAGELGSVRQQAGRAESGVNAPALPTNVHSVSIAADGGAAAMARPQLAAGGEAASGVKWWQISADRRGFAERRPVNLPLLALIIGVHVIMLSLVAANRMRVAVKPTRTLVVFDVKLLEAPPALPPPPQPAAKTIADPPEPVIAPPPIVASAAAPSPIVIRVEQPPVTPPPAPSPPAPPATVAGNDLTTTLLSAVPPRYPLESRRKHEEGTVVLSVLVGTDGRVATISLHRSSGFPRLDAAALAAVKRWRWSPRVVNGTAVQVAGLVPMPFELKQR